MIEYEVIDRLDGYATMEDRIYIKFIKYPEEWKKPIRLLSCLESRKSMRMRVSYDVNAHNGTECINADRATDLDGHDVPVRTVEQISLYNEHKKLLDTKFPNHNNNAISLFMPSELDDDMVATVPRYQCVSGNYDPHCQETKEMVHKIIHDKVRAWSFLCYHNDKLS